VSTEPSRHGARSIVAIVRPPSDALARCELTHLAREPVDLPRARDQHAAYAALLRDLGARVLTLPPEPDLPDAVFVEDVAVVLDQLAVMTIPGARSRGPEVETVAAVLSGFRPLARLSPPATLDGGDVLRVERTLYVGQSSRTNAAGVAQLARHVAPLGCTVRPVRITGCLHLKSACSYLGRGILLANPDWMDLAAVGGLEILPVDPAEPRAANTLRVGDVVVMADGFPRTLARIEQRGFAVRVVSLTELQKAEAGGSCMSLIFPELDRAPEAAQRET
jgi:dimethylargininase